MTLTGLKRYGLVLGLVLIIALVAPVMAGGTVTLNNGDSIADAIALGNTTIYLNPGTYDQPSSITLSSGSITIEANTSAVPVAGNPTNTFIDGVDSGFGIFFINAAGVSLTLDNLTLENGEYNNGGAIFNNIGSTVTIFNSTFTGCTATGNGGAILNGGTLTISNSTFTGCTATGNGGAIWNGGTIIGITSSTFTDCTATGFPSEGGAIWNGGTIIGITSSTFTDCTATGAGGEGGAIANDGTIDGITSSTFTGCTADARGGAILNGGTITMSFSRIYDNTAADGSAIYAAGGTTAVTDNWWGTNGGPGGAVDEMGGITTDSPWLVLGVTASPATIATTQTSTIRANLTYSYNGATYTDTTSGGKFVPDGIPVSFSGTGVTGTFSPSTTYTINGVSTTTFIPSATGGGMVDATVDGQMVGAALTINPPTPLQGIGAITGTPQAGQTLTSGTVTPSAATVNYQWNESASINGPYVPISDAISTTYTPVAGDVGYYLEVNVTGTGGYTGFANSTPVGPVIAAPTPMPTPTSSGGHGSRTDYWATSGGTSDQGYTGPQPTPVGLSQPTPRMVDQQLGSGGQAPQSNQVAGSTPVVVQQTVAAPPAASTGPSGGIPVVSVVAGVAGIGVLTGGGFLVRRWWIHRQNPALFRKDD
jgi:hypothetical protein